MIAWLERRGQNPKVLHVVRLAERGYLGSGPDSLSPIDHPRVAPRQCVIWRDGSQYRIRDLGAGRGRTLVNFQYVKEAQLVPGDQVLLGDAVFTFKLRRAVA